MQNPRHLFVIAAAALLAGNAALARDDCGRMGRGDGERHGMMRGDPGEMRARFERHLAHFKDELKITPQQEALWTAYADKVKQNAGSAMAAMRDRLADAKLSAVERMERMNAIMKERLTAAEAAADSFKQLYASLTPEQKAAADRHMSHHMGPGGAHHKGGDDEPHDHPHG